MGLSAISLLDSDMRGEFVCMDICSVTGSIVITMKLLTYEFCSNFN